MFAFLKKIFGKADVNKDGRVDGKDAKVAAAGVKAKGKASTVRAKATIKKAANKVTKTTAKTKNSK